MTSTGSIWREGRDTMWRDVRIVQRFNRKSPLKCATAFEIHSESYWEHWRVFRRRREVLSCLRAGKKGAGKSCCSDEALFQQSQSRVAHTGVSKHQMMGKDYLAVPLVGASHLTLSSFPKPQWSLAITPIPPGKNYAFWLHEFTYAEFFLYCWRHQL